VAESRLPRCLMSRLLNEGLNDAPSRGSNGCWQLPGGGGARACEQAVFGGTRIVDMLVGE
jgi:hypothetical protein